MLLSLPQLRDSDDQRGKVRDQRHRGKRAVAGGVSQHRD
jgi:hypothetical protein